MRNILDEIIRILASRLFLNENEISKITDKTVLLTVCDDSLDLLDAVMALEDHFNINIPTAESFRTIGDLRNFIEENLNA